jgi:magnesium transporter
MVRALKICGNYIAESSNGTGEILLYINPNESEKKQLVGEMKIDEHTLASATDPNEQARIEFEPDHTAIIIKRPKSYTSEDNFFFRVLSIGLFKFSDRLVIVVTEDIPLFDGKQFQNVNSLLDVVLKMIYRSIIHFVEHLKVINMCSEELEHKVNRSMENRQLLNMFTLEKSLVYYLNAISTNRRVIDRMKANIMKMGFSTDEQELLDDMAIENAQCYEQAQILSQVLSSLMDARASVVNNNLNLLMRTLTIIMIALMLPTLWTSLFSMNVPIPFQKEGWLFYMILLLGGMMVAFILTILKLRRW